MSRILAMSYDHMLAEVICKTFETTPEAGKWQRKAPVPKAMLVTFATRIDHDKEDGYRYRDLLLFGPMNYVQVWTRRRSTVIPIEDLADEEDGGLKPGKDYKTTEEPWTLIGDHDSCWRDSVQSFLRTEKADINGFSGPSWFQVIERPLELEVLYEKERNRRRGG